MEYGLIMIDLDMLKLRAFRSNGNFHNLILGALAVDAMDPENRRGSSLLVDINPCGI